MSKTLRICSTLLGATTTAAAAPTAPSHAHATYHHFNRADFRHFGAGGASFFTTLSQLTKLSTDSIQQDMKKGSPWLPSLRARASHKPPSSRR